MEAIHATKHYTIWQPADGSFLIVPTDDDGRYTLAQVTQENDLDLENNPIHEDGSCTIGKDNPFELVRTVEQCEARVAIMETRRETLHAGDRRRGNPMTDSPAEAS